MEKLKRFLLILIGVALMIPVMNSCKKGEEDPSFSFYSRKHRLCQDWKFSYYKRIQQDNDTITSWEFDGSSMRKLVGTQLYISSAVMKITFKTDGSYVWDEKVTTDTSTYTYYEEGSWYFTGGGKDSDTKYKELLALQTNKATRTLQAGGITTTDNYFSTGNVDATVYNIIKLSSDEVKLKSRLETNFIQISPNETDMQILTVEITLKKNL
jgi:hypothetical protein